jgi:hypothetical protein
MKDKPERKKPTRSIESIVMQREKPTTKELIERGILDENGKPIKVDPSRQGRPEIYDPNIHPYQAFTMCARMGSTIDEMAAVFMVGAGTVSRWMEKYSEFALAIRSGRDAFNVGVIEQSLIKRATGYSYEEVTKKQSFYKKKQEDGSTVIVPIEEIQTTIKHVPASDVAIIFYLSNRSKGRWKQKQEVVTIHEDGETIKKTLSGLSLEDVKLLRDISRKAITGDSVQSQSINISYEQPVEAESVEEERND